jgi:uncharacterized protein YjbI with pentapeptide repeats
MANSDHVQTLRQGVDTWNAWREREPHIPPDLIRADLRKADLRGADFSKANLSGANLNKTRLHIRSVWADKTDLRVDFTEADLSGAYLYKANLRHANLFKANLSQAHLSKANLSGAFLYEVNAWQASLREANLFEADLFEANLSGAYLFKANLSRANLKGANLTGADLRGANLSGADLSYVSLVDALITTADLTGCRVYGVSAWGVEVNDKTSQRNLIIQREGEPEITVDNIEVAQFVYLLLNNAKIRDVIDTVGKKGVLLLGRFTEGRITVLERLRAELRERGYLPIVFNFDKPKTKDFTETVRLLAGLSHFVIADVTNPKSAPLELQASVPEIMVPFLPIIEEGEKPFAMLADLWIKHRDWVFEPLHYSSLDALVRALDKEIIGPAEARFDELVVRKAETMKGKHVY